MANEENPLVDAVAARLAEIQGVTAPTAPTARDLDEETDADLDDEVAGIVSTVTVIASWE